MEQHPVEAVEVLVSPVLDLDPPGGGGPDDAHARGERPLKRLLRRRDVRIDRLRRAAGLAGCVARGPLRPGLHFPDRKPLRRDPLRELDDDLRRYLDSEPVRAYIEPKSKDAQRLFDKDAKKE